MFNHRRGFTLVELLVVISIIALLVSILMPSLNIARMQATGAVCLANQRSMILAWRMYAEENNGKMVSGNTYPIENQYSWVDYTYITGVSTVEDKQEACRTGKLFPYLETVDVYHCPGDRRELRSTEVAFRSYSIAGGFYGFLESVNTIGQWEVFPYTKISQIKRPSEKYVFVEESDGRGYNIGSWVLFPVAKHWVDPLSIWHNNKSTLGFADGHAEMHRWEDERTVEMSEMSTFFAYHPDSVDFEYMVRHYGYARLP